MNITVIGTGYLGAVHAACTASLGHDVLGIDSDEQRVKLLAAGEAPFFEPGLPELLASMIQAGRLRFSTSLAEAADFGAVHFICVGTPQLPDALAADTRPVEVVAADLAPLLRRECLVVGKSTVPIGTAALMAARIARLAPVGRRAELAWNPEFLREGHALADSLHPARIVVGATSARADATLRLVYEPLLAAGVPYISTDLNTAELVKASANALLATKISFINAMADICEVAGADVMTLAMALGYDGRIGHGALSPGLGFGGGCLPKDLRALVARADELGVATAGFLRAVDAINLSRRARIVEITRDLLGGLLRGRTVAVLGAAFKPLTDDVRDSPALDVAGRLRHAGASVRVHDPCASGNAQAACPGLNCTPEVSQACQDADVVLHLTEWPQYRGLDPIALRAVVRQPVILDARNALPLDRWRAAGWLAHGMGVRTATPAPWFRQPDRML